MDEAPTPRLLLLIWAKIGLKSFGGGPAVQIYAYEEFVDHRGWLRPQEWAELWGLCQVVPGINLLALVTLTGRRFAGGWGVAAGMAGVLAPSIAVTVAVAALYERLQSVGVVAGAIHGVVMAAAGGNLVMSWRVLRPILSKSLTQGKGVLVVAIVATLAVAVGVFLGRLPVYLLLVSSGLIMATTVWVAARRAQVAFP